MNHSEQVTELRKQIRFIDALLAKSAAAGPDVEAQLENLCLQAQAFLKGCILVQERFNQPQPALNLPEFEQIDLFKTENQQIGVHEEPIEAKSPPPPSPEPIQSTEKPLESASEEREDKEKLQKTKEKPEVVSKPVNTQRLADKLHRGQVKDLRKALPLHEKFRFINELFKGNSENFDAALQDLEAAGSVEKAIALLSIFQHQKGWEPEHPLLEKWIELIEKRFS